MPEPLRVAIRVRSDYGGLEPAGIECEPRVGTKVALPGHEPKRYHTVLGQQSTQHDVFMSCGVLECENRRYPQQVAATSLLMLPQAFPCSSRCSAGRIRACLRMPAMWGVEILAGG